MKRPILALLAAMAIPGAAHAELVVSSLSVGVWFQMNVENSPHELTLDAIYIGKPAVDIQPFHSVSIDETRNWTTGIVQGTFTESLDTFVEYHPADQDAYASAQAELTDFAFTIGSFLTLTGNRFRGQEYEMWHNGSSTTGHSMEAEGLNLTILGNAVSLSGPLTEGDVIYDQDGLAVRYGYPGTLNEAFDLHGLYISLNNFEHNGHTYNGFMILGGADAKILDNPVPEPASVLALGVGALAIARRKKRPLRAR